MKAIVNTNGTLESLQILDFPKPGITSNEDVLIQIKAVSLNPVDYKVIPSQDYGAWPRIIGFDGAGVVVETTMHTQGFKAGDRVYFHGSILLHGVFAEYAIAKYTALSHIKDDFSFELAAAMPCAGFTAQQLLGYRLPEVHGKNIFIQGASGGVGSFAILLAKKRGFHVFASASPKNHDYVKSLGADVVFDYHGDELGALKGLLQKDLLDVVILSQSLTPSYSGALYPLMNFGSAIFPLLGLSEIAPPPFMKSLTFSSASLGGGYVHHNVHAEMALARMGHDLMKILTPQEIAPIISQKISFEEIPAVLHRLKAGNLGHCGKIVCLLD
ncbi:MAG: alcohol dehydrogenase catalytic domain-containing protein [Spirochaetia bacterium]